MRYRDPDPITSPPEAWVCCNNWSNGEGCIKLFKGDCSSNMLLWMLECLVFLLFGRHSVKGWLHLSGDQTTLFGRHSVEGWLHLSDDQTTNTPNTLAGHRSVCMSGCHQHRVLLMS